MFKMKFLHYNNSIADLDFTWSINNNIIETDSLTLIKNIHKRYYPKLIASWPITVVSNKIDGLLIKIKE